MFEIIIQKIKVGNYAEALKDIEQALTTENCDKVKLIQVCMEIYITIISSGKLPAYLKILKATGEITASLINLAFSGYDSYWVSLASCYLDVINMYVNVEEQTELRIDKILENLNKITPDEKLVQLICCVNRALILHKKNHLALKLLETLLLRIPTTNKILILNLQKNLISLYCSLDDVERYKQILDDFIINLKLFDSAGIEAKKIFEEFIEDFVLFENKFVKAIPAEYLHYFILKADRVLRDKILEKLFSMKGIFKTLVPKLINASTNLQDNEKFLGEHVLIATLTEEYLQLRLKLSNAIKFGNSLKKHFIYFYYLCLAHISVNGKKLNDDLACELLLDYQNMLSYALSECPHSLLRPIPSNLEFMNSEAYWIDAWIRQFYQLALVLSGNSVHHHLHVCTDNCSHGLYHTYNSLANLDNKKIRHNFFLTHHAEVSTHFCEIQPSLSLHLIRSAYIFLRLNLTTEFKEEYLLKFEIEDEINEQMFTNLNFPQHLIKSLIRKLLESYGVVLKSLSAIVKVKEAKVPLRKLIEKKSIVKLMNALILLILDYFAERKAQNLFVEQFCRTIRKLAYIPKDKDVQDHFRILKKQLKDGEQYLGWKIISRIQSVWDIIKTNDTDVKLAEKITSLDIFVEDLLGNLDIISLSDFKQLIKMGESLFIIILDRNKLVIKINEIKIMETINQALSHSKIEFNWVENDFIIKNFRIISKNKLSNFERYISVSLKKIRRMENNSSVNQPPSSLSIQSCSDLNNNNSFPEREVVEKPKRLHDPNKVSKNEQRRLEIVQKLKSTSEKSNKKTTLQQKNTIANENLKNAIEPNKTTIETEQPADLDNSNSTMITAPLIMKQKVTVKLNNVDNLESALFTINTADIIQAKEYPQLKYTNNHAMHLKNVIDELANPQGQYLSDSLILRYHTLYHCTRMMVIFYETKLQLPRDLTLQITRLRMIFAKSPDILLDPEFNHPDFFSTNYYSLFKISFRIYKRVSHILRNIPTDSINIEKNALYKFFYPNNSGIDIKLIKCDFNTVLECISKKIKNRLVLFLSKIASAEELDKDLFRLSAIKMFLAEIGYLARQLRDQHPADCKEQLKSDLQFKSMNIEFIKSLSTLPILSHKYFLPGLDTIDPNFHKDILTSLSLSDALCWCIEIRNSIDHENPFDENEFDLAYFQELNTSLIFNFANFMLTLAKPLLACTIRSTLNVNAKPFMPSNIPYLNHGGLFPVSHIPPTDEVETQKEHYTSEFK